MGVYVNFVYGEENGEKTLVLVGQPSIKSGVFKEWGDAQE